MLEDANLTEEDFENAKEQSLGTMIIVDGIEYATNLFWQPLQNKEDPYMEVEEASQGILEGADLFCIKPGKAPQFGICVSSEGYKKGQEAAAVPLATALSDRPSFIAVFKVSNGWWYTCIRNDIILSDGDILFINEEDARAQFESMLAVPDWGRKIAPVEWGIEDTESPDLTRLMQRGIKAKLQKIKALRGTKLLLVVGVSAIVGLWLVFNIITEIFLAPPKRPIVVPVPPKMMPVVEPLPEVRPWEHIRNPSQVMIECENSVIKLLAIMPPGWEIGPIRCSQSGASTNWNRNVGRISWIRKALNESGINVGGNAFSDDGNSMVTSVAFSPVDEVNSAPGDTEPNIKSAVNELFQSIGQSIAVGSGSVAITQPSNDPNAKPVQKTYRFVTIRFTSRYNPRIWKDLLTKFSGLEIKNITYTPSSKNWDYEGAIYVL